MPDDETTAGPGAECVRLHVNGWLHVLEIGSRQGQVDSAHTLAHTLRETLGLTGTKVSCDRGACGCCTVLLEGQAVLSCSTLTVECNGREVTTIEGLADAQTGALDPLQQAFIDHGAFQCGFCTPGMIMSAKALLILNQNPSEDEIREALSGNFCRCGAHQQIVRAVKDAAGRSG